MHPYATEYPTTKIRAVALLEPSRVKGLVVLDIAPVQYTTAEPHWSAVQDIITTLVDVQLTAQQRRDDVDAQLRSRIPDPNLRAFCLTNVDWSTGQWKIPLDRIHKQLDRLADFDVIVPAAQQSLSTETPQLYTGDAFFIHGGQSKFVRSSHLTTIQQYFPNHMLTTIRGAGHWVHAEAPEDTTALIQRFLDR
jgi:esterase